jgi:hypothetical protein
VGTKGRTGWFAAPRYRTGRNNPPWIGNNWTVATKGQGPRGINDALADHIDDLRGEVAVEVDRMAAKAFRTASSGVTSAKRRTRRATRCRRAPR